MTRAERKKQLRNRVTTTLAFVGMLVVLFTSLTICGYYETHYTREADVMEVKGDTIVVVDWFSGNSWEFYGDGYKVGDEVKMKMFNNYTDNDITDDEILDVKIINRLY